MLVRSQLGARNGHGFAAVGNGGNLLDRVFAEKAGLDYRIADYFHGL